MSMTNKLNLSDFDSNHLDEVSDETLSKIILQVYPSVGTTEGYTRAELESAAGDALGEAECWAVEAQADRFYNTHNDC